VLPAAVVVNVNWNSNGRQLQLPGVPTQPTVTRNPRKVQTMDIKPKFTFSGFVYFETKESNEY